MHQRRSRRHFHNRNFRKLRQTLARIGIQRYTLFKRRRGEVVLQSGVIRNPDMRPLLHNGGKGKR